MNKYLKENLLILAWTIALLAFAGSLYYSNVRGFTPCVLCWYQRICLYPLVLLIPIGIYKRDRNAYAYILPLSIIAVLIGIYQNLLYYNVISETLTTCAFGVSCTTKYVDYFGFISIPLLALLASLSITVLVLVDRKLSKHDPRS